MRVKFEFAAAPRVRERGEEGPGALEALVKAGKSDKMPIYLIFKEFL
jgi:hypothetical protein